MSRSAPASPFQPNEEEDRPVAGASSPYQSHSTSVILPVKTASATPASHHHKASNPSERDQQSSSQRFESSSSFSAPNSPSGARRVTIHQALSSSPPQHQHHQQQAHTPPHAFILNHPQLQRLRDESGGSGSNNNRRISLCRFSLQSNSRPSSSSPVLIHNFTSAASAAGGSPSSSAFSPSNPYPRPRSFSQFGNFSQSFPSFGHPIRSSTICVSFTPGIPSSGSITVRRTRTDPSVSFKASQQQSQQQLPVTSNIRTTGNVIHDMNLNRQQSAPAHRPTHGPDAGRQLSVDVGPQRPASASPTPKVMRLVPIMQPVEASVDADPLSRPIAKQQQQSQQSQQPSSNIVAAGSMVSKTPDYPNQVFTSQQSQANYIQCKC